MNIVLKGGLGFSLITVIRSVLCAAVLVFSFSVALTNVFLGAALVLGILSGNWWTGAKRCWHEFRSLSIAFLSYFALLILGLLWSQSVDWGLHILGRHWFWLLLPLLVVTLSDEKWRKYFLLSLSLGLALHLLFCVLQSFGYVDVTTDGSGVDNATGHIGHIGFGFVYGVWAAWLLLLGLNSNDRSRYLYWLFAIWAYVMIFAAQGRSGYIIAFTLAMAVVVKWSLGLSDWKRGLWIGFSVCVLLVIALSFGPAKERFLGTWSVIIGEKQVDSGYWQENAVEAASQRVQIWQSTLDIYYLNPILGVGTGGFPHAVSLLKEKGDSASPFIFSHPHNQYLLTLVRWGPAGVIIFSLLLFYWLREGWRRDWQKSTTASLAFLPAFALIIHGLTSSSMEEHFSAILAVLLLGAALSEETMIQEIKDVE